MFKKNPQLTPEEVCSQIHLQRTTYDSQSSKEPTEHELVLSGNSRKAMFQYLGAGIAMMIFRLHSALSQQDKLDSCVTATLKIVISMSLVTCALPTKYWNLEVPMTWAASDNIV
ncbi:uncharacterized protein LOC108199055 [Daucus carota subsp. sativus]|uniref:uncharacterized protein LOC108199055 n=1 Tax=Daucus carota subsp. sativus TaxID=79200 RepID=UPI0030827CD0